MVTERPLLRDGVSKQLECEHEFEIVAKAFNRCGQAIEA
jgi:hypothetical protein